MGHEQRKTPWTQHAYVDVNGNVREYKQPSTEPVPTEWLHSPNRTGRIRIGRVILKEAFWGIGMHPLVRTLIIRENGFCAHATFTRHPGERVYWRTN
jgi:hypothetical protein